MELRVANTRCGCPGAARNLILGVPVVYTRTSEKIRDKVGEFRERFIYGAFHHHFAGKPDIRALNNHAEAQVLGRTTNGTLRFVDGPAELRCEIDPPDTTFAKDLMINLRRGDINHMSFGFDCDEDDWGEEGFDGEICAVRTVRRARLHEVSPVTFPAYPQTHVSLGEQSLRSLKRYLDSRPVTAWRRALADRLQRMAESA